MTEADSHQPDMDTLRTAFHDAPMGIFICDSGGRYLSVNPRMAELFGYSTPEDFLREVEHVNDQVSNDGADAEGGDGCLGEVGEHQDCEVQVRLPSGEQAWRSRWLRVVSEDGGGPRRFVGAVVDIAERKRLEDVREKGISAALYSLIETAKACGLNPHEYLLHVFEKLPYAACEDDLKALLPQGVMSKNS